jgi:hypothetical protein
MSGTSPACTFYCPAEQTWGIWLLQYRSPPPAPARPIQDPLLRSSAPAIATLVLAFATRTAGHLLTDGRMPYGAANCPPIHTPNVTQPQRNPNTWHIQHRCCSYVELMSFREIVCIERSTPICGRYEPPSHSRTFPNPDLGPQGRPVAYLSKPPRAGIGQPGTADRSRPRPRRTRAPPAPAHGRDRSQP